MITESFKTYSGAYIGLKHTLNRGPLKFPEDIAKLTCLFPRKWKTKTTTTTTTKTTYLSLLFKLKRN